VRVNRFDRGILLGGLLTLACTHTSAVERRAQEDGSYRVDCRLSLARCLASIEQVCGQGYEVLRAREERRLAGPIEPNEPIVISEVVARCRKDGSLIGGGEKPSPPASSSPAVPSRSCTPGATQACVGPAACRGGQQCLADGMAFGPCDCGPAAPAAPTVSPAAPEAGAATPR